MEWNAFLPDASFISNLLVWNAHPLQSLVHDQIFKAVLMMCSIMVGGRGIGYQSLKLDVSSNLLYWRNVQA